MKKIHTYVLYCLIMVCTSSTLQAQQPFYGTVVYDYELKMTNEEEYGMAALIMPKSLTTVYGKKAVMTYFEGGMMASMMGKIVLNKDKIYTLKADEKVAYVMRDEDMDQANQDSVLSMQLVRGKKEKILGYSCNLYEVTILQGDKRVEQEVWATDKLRLASGYRNQISTNMGFMYKDYDVFPLKIKVKMDEMGGVMTLLATDLDFTVPQASYFDIPKDYEEKPFSEMNPMDGY